ncbi:MAG: hypothetical protein Kow0069_20240 [Promethearchaeota archaeon]
MVESRLSSFQGAVEFRSFVDYLLYASTAGSGLPNITSMIGLGGPSQDFLLAWDPFREIFYTTVSTGPQDDQTIVFYARVPDVLREEVEDYAKKFQLDVSGPFLEHFFTKKEVEMFFSTKKKIFVVTAAECSVGKSGEKPPEVGVDTYFPDLLSFLTGFGQARTILLLEGNDDEPNVAVTFSFSPFPDNRTKSNRFGVNAYMDVDRELSGKQFVEVTQDFEVRLVEKLAQIDHKSQYTLVAPVASLSPP